MSNTQLTRRAKFSERFRRISAGIALGAIAISIPIWLSACATTDNTYEVHKPILATFKFDTRKTAQACPVTLVRGEKYHISARVIAADPWMDGGSPASPLGVDGPLTPQQKADEASKRVRSERRFKLMGSIGNGPNRATFPVGYDTELTPDATGQLFLFVNDTPGDYFKNRGSAIIQVECITPE